MTHSIHPAMGAAESGANGSLLRALFAALRARAARARRAAAARQTLRVLESLDPDQLRDIGLRRGDLRRALCDDPRA